MWEKYSPEKLRIRTLYGSGIINFSYEVTASWRFEIALNNIFFLRKKSCFGFFRAKTIVISCDLKLCFVLL